jgi:phosphatidate cytidylyltransferase
MKRWITGIIGLPLLIYVVGFAPRWLLPLLLFLITVVGLIEFLRITWPESPLAFRAFAAFLALILFLSVTRGVFYITVAVIPLFASISFFVALFFFGTDMENRLRHVIEMVFAQVYISVPLALVVLIDKHPAGNVWIFFLLAVVFLNDTGAFYFGRYFGRHKLYPSVSPGKTWEGAVGGFFCGLIPVYVFFFARFFTARPLALFGLAAGIAVAGQIGDLAESLIKRTYGVKDSGNILPGHGGVLDRIDALLFGIPVLYIYLFFAAT